MKPSMNSISQRSSRIAVGIVLLCLLWLSVLLLSAAWMPAASSASPSVGQTAQVPATDAPSLGLSVALAFGLAILTACWAIVRRSQCDRPLYTLHDARAAVDVPVLAIGSPR
jgi:hypothetical protein